MPRPGGNPILAKYQIRSTRSVPLHSHLSMKITDSMMEQLRALPCDWREFVREAIAFKLKEVEQQPSPVNHKTSDGEDE